MQASSEVRDFLLMLRRRRWFVMTWAVSVITLAISLAYMLPAVYRSGGTLIFESSDISEDLLRSTVVSYADQQIDLLRRRVMTVEQLGNIIRESDHYPDADLSPRAKAMEIIDNIFIEQVDPVSLEPSDEYPAYTISFSHSDPIIARDTALAVVELFLEDNTRRRTESAKSAFELLGAEAGKLKLDLDEAEGRLSEFKKRFGDALPEAKRANQDRLTRAQDEIVDINREIRIVEERRSLLALRIEQISPTLVGSFQDWRTQLAQLESELNEARQKYTPDHPDVLRLTNAIRQLREENAGVKTSLGTPDNPAYLEAKSQLDAVNAELSALRSEATIKQQQINNYRESLLNAPDIEKQYSSLTRDYEIAQDNYRQVREKQAQANFAISLEENMHGETIRLIRPPRVPEIPFSPNRLGIVLLGIMLSVGGAIGIATLMEMADDTVRGSRDLLEILNMPPIAAIPQIANPRDIMKRRMRFAFGGGGLIACVAMIALATSYFL